ncbi:MAG TPA: hypothetical protein VNJ02_00490 [Vicinamibacterales bacterium]|nr:hypothetical protein [Vicinamibacterales bacterium]
MRAVVSYRIDEYDSIAALGDDWVSFAIANDAPHLADVTGRSLWDFVSDSTTRQVYRRLLARVRHGHTIRFSYRCDAPLLKRFMQMTMRPAPAGGSDVRERHGQNGTVRHHQRATRGWSRSLAAGVWLVQAGRR